jgi:hypothetical protein
MKRLLNVVTLGALMSMGLIAQGSAAHADSSNLIGVWIGPVNYTYSDASGTVKEKFDGCSMRFETFLKGDQFDYTAGFECDGTSQEEFGNYTIVNGNQLTSDFGTGSIIQNTDQTLQFIVAYGNDSAINIKLVRTSASSGTFEFVLAPSNSSGPANTIKGQLNFVNP